MKKELGLKLIRIYLNNSSLCRDVENFFSISDIRSDKLRKFARPNENMPDRTWILHRSTSNFTFWLIFVCIDSNNTSPTKLFSEITCISYAPDWWCEQLAHFTKTKFEEPVRHSDQYLSNFCQTRANFISFAGMSDTFRHLCLWHACFHLYGLHRAARNFEQWILQNEY